MKKMMIGTILCFLVLGWTLQSYSGESVVPITNENVGSLKGHWEGERDAYLVSGIVKQFKTEVEITNETFPLSGKVTLEGSASLPDPTPFKNGKLKDGSVVIDLSGGTVILSFLDTGKLKIVYKPARSLRRDQDGILTKK